MAEETKSTNETEVTISHGPGQVVTPTSGTTPLAPPITTNPPTPLPDPAPIVDPEPVTPPPPAVVATTPIPETETAVEQAEQIQPVTSTPEPATEPEPPKGLFHADDEGFDGDVPPKQAIEPVSWTASEFVHHEKTAGWYMALTGATIALAGAVYLFTREVISAVVVIFGALTLGFYGARKPRQVEYQLDASGLTIGAKHFRYGEFKSFSVASEGAFSSIVFMPMKRFAPPTSIYLAPDDEEKIIRILTTTLPFEEHKKDAVDKLMHKIRF